MNATHIFRSKILFLCILLAVSISSAHILSGHASSNLVRKDLNDFPARIGSWNGEDQKIPNPMLEKLGVDDHLMRVYTKEPDHFWLYIGYYKSQQGAKTIHSPKHCYPGSGWQKLDSSIISVRVTGNNGGEKTIPVNRYLLEKNGERELVYYWYQSAGSVEASEIRAAILRFWNALFKKRTDGALVRISTRMSSTNTGGRGELVDVIPILYPLLSGYIPD